MPEEQFPVGRERAAPTEPVSKTGGSLTAKQAVLVSLATCVMAAESLPTILQLFTARMLCF